MSAKVMLLGMIGTAVLAAGIAVAAITLTNRPDPTPKQPRFLVVERPGQSPSPAPQSANVIAEVPPDGTTPAPALHPGDAASPQPADNTQTNPVPKVGPSPAGGAAKATDGGVGALNRTFAKRTSALQNCFVRNADGLQGSPQVTIRFQVGTSGTVESAGLQPAALSGTALGSCVLGVARSTVFPPQEKPVTFSIPFRASVSKQ
jgi:hypothetical protein